MTRPGRQARQAPAGLPHRVLLSAYYDHRKARMICLLNGLMAAAILGFGAVLAVRLDSLNYINRMGGMITALSLLLALHQFRFEQRHKNEEALSAQAAALVAQDRHYPSGFAREVVGRARRGTAQRVESARQMI